MTFLFFTATVNNIGISVKYAVNDVDKKGPQIPKIGLLYCKLNVIVILVTDLQSLSNS